MKEIKIGTAVSKTAGRKTGALRIGTLPDGSPMEIPVVIVRGKKPGPVLWLHGCVHGNEYCGTFIIHALLARLKPAALAGTVVALPALNITAFQKGQRMSPFEGFAGGDLNRNFPGDPDGTLTQQMGHAIYKPLKRYATHLVDFHTAMTEDVRWALYAAVGGKVEKESEKLARAFGYSSTLPAPPTILGGSALMTAAKDGIAAMIVECGGKGPAFTEEAVEDGAERLHNILRALKMVSGAVTDHGKLNYFSNFAWVHATKGGLFQRSVRCGDRIEPGSVLGQFYDLHGRPNGEATAPKAGIVLAIHPGPMIGSGETLVHIGLDPREV
ncbi:MAG: succinylglutamate desuccinylase/aspartoacylase family protein [Alphaproteobacteria bacterium]|nr:succinylglutamate desuccinylase/aspartoacylase family protein [Alphaproteobacteria bacterium]